MKREHVKKSRYFLKGDDRGASLIAVIVAVVFVLIITTITLEVTTANIRMRDIEVSGKENFYSAEQYMDEVMRAMADIAAQEVEEAYTELLSRYGTVADQGGKLQDEFKQIYMKKLETYFLIDDIVGGDAGGEDVNGGEGDSDSEDDDKVKFSPIKYTQSKDGYAVGTYSTGLVRNAFEKNLRKMKLDEKEFEKVKNYLKLDEPIFTTDYENGLFTLKNVKIIYPDQYGYETWLSADLVFKTPVFQFDDIKKPFMYYALIADDSISVIGDGVNVNGSVYAGWHGIQVGSEADISVTFRGENIVTRGDIVVRNNAAFTIGNPQIGTAHIWAENIITENDKRVRGNGGPTLVMDGEINVADDLELNGYNSDVTLKGSYNGYNFRKTYNYTETGNYEGSLFANESQYSSAIMINGENSRLDLTGLNHLLIAGRTFISRGPKGAIASGIPNYDNNIMLGESLSLRSDQIAYYVDARYFERDDAGNVILENNLPKIDEEVYAADTGVEEVTQYLKPSQLVEYKYSFQYSTIRDFTKMYYLDFNDEDSANRFFAKYWDSNSAKLGAYGEDFANAIIIDSVRALTLTGDIIYRNETGTDENPFSLLQVQITNKEIEEGWVPKKIYWERADLLARTYRSLEKDLKGDSSEIAKGEVREFVDKEVDESGETKIIKTYENKEGPSLFYELIIKDKFETFCKKKGENNTFKKEFELSDGNEYTILLKYDENTNEVTELTPYSISEDVFKGIVISNANINVDIDLEGMVISGGVISLDKKEVQVTGNSDLILELIKKAEDEYPELVEIFRDYEPSEDEDGDGGRRISDYMTYENWTKNEG